MSTTEGVPGGTLYDAGRAFLESWEELLVSLPDDYGCTLTCEEAEGFKAFADAFGYADLGSSVLANHAERDDPGDEHYQGEDPE